MKSPAAVAIPSTLPMDDGAGCSQRNSSLDRTMEQHPYLHCCGEEASSVGTELESKGEIAMKTILSALVALSVVAGVAGTASAFDAKTLYEQLDRERN